MYFVSILIFMEHLLQLHIIFILSKGGIGFNPYFYGTSTSTQVMVDLLLILTVSFNPYFYGTSTSTLYIFIKLFIAIKVSILIFMEHLLQLPVFALYRCCCLCFNPYFYGTSTSTITTKQNMDVDTMAFQSLFLWNIYFNF